MRRLGYLSILWAFLPFLPLSASVKMYTSDFSKGKDGWIGDFTGYPISEEESCGLNWGLAPLPDDETSEGLFISGMNLDLGLFMFFKRKFSGLESNTTYQVACDVEIVSNVGPGSIGVGGSRTASFFKIGALAKEPEKVIFQEDPHKRPRYILNAEKGDGPEDGSDAVTVGSVVNPEVDPENPSYLRKNINNKCKSLYGKTNDLGELWIFLGNDSPYPGHIVYGVASIRVALRNNIDTP